MGRGGWLSHIGLMHKWTVIVGREWRGVGKGDGGAHGGTRRGERGRLSGILCEGPELIT